MLIDGHIWLSLFHTRENMSDVISKNAVDNGVYEQHVAAPDECESVFRSVVEAALHIIPLHSDSLLLKVRHNLCPHA